MEFFSGDKEENSEDFPGRKKWKLKSLRTRLFGKSKRSDEGRGTQLSQSAGDITAGEGLGSDEDLACCQGMIGSRALSHDSIFLADQVESDTRPDRGASQDDVHSRIKALQMKLQQQKMHLGPPPMVLPIRRPEDPGSQSEDSNAHSPPERLGGDVTPQGALKMMPACPLSPTVKPAAARSLSQTPSRSVPLSAPSNPPSSSSSSAEPPLDFSTPAHVASCLDSSAARHRMLVKPRNQRASTKKKPHVVQASCESEPSNNTDQLESVEEAEQPLGAPGEVTVEEDRADISSQSLLSKPAAVAVVSSAAAAQPSHFPPPDYALPGTVSSVTSQVLRVKPGRHVDVSPGQRPHSSYMEGEREKRGDFQIQALSQEIRNAVDKPRLTEASSNQLLPSVGSSSAFKSSSVPQQADDQSTRGLKRPAPGSGSFHFSISSAKNRGGERPRSGSFVGVLEQIESRQRASKQNQEKAAGEEEDSKGSPGRGTLHAAGRLRPDVEPAKSWVTPWDRTDSLKRGAAKHTPTDADTAEAEEGRTGQEPVEMAEEAKEVQEDEGKMAFGVRLRSTSQSVRQRPEPPTQCDTSVTERLQNSCSTSPSDLRPADPAPSGLSPPVKHHTAFTDEPLVTSAEVQPTAEGPQQQQAASSEVSWMSLAVEKTRSLQQLFTSRFPRDLQTAGRAQAPAQPTSLTESVTPTQSAKIPQSATRPPAADAVRAEQGRSHTQAVRPSAGGPPRATAAPPDRPLAPRELHTATQSAEEQPESVTAQRVSAARPSVHTNPRTTQCSSRSPAHAEAPSQAPHGGNAQSLAQAFLPSGQQPPPRTGRGLHPANQLKSTAAAPTSASAAPASGTQRADRDAGPPSPSLSSRRAGWTGSVSDRAAFLDRRADWKSPPGPNGVELRKSMTEVQTSAEPLAKIPPPSKDTVPEGRHGVKLRESSPTKVPEKLREDKWLRKSVAQPSSPSSSPSTPSVLQSLSDSGQPSWMELAKRKSMAWSDKTMD